MKTLTLLFILFLSSLAAIAQNADSVSIKSRKLYLGVSLNSISFHIYYKNKQTCYEGAMVGAAGCGLLSPTLIGALGCGAFVILADSVCHEAAVRYYEICIKYQ